MSGVGSQRRIGCGCGRCCGGSDGSRFGNGRCDGSVATDTECGTQHFVLLPSFRFKVQEETTDTNNRTPSSTDENMSAGIKHTMIVPTLAQAQATLLWHL